MEYVECKFNNTNEMLKWELVYMLLKKGFKYPRINHSTQRGYQQQHYSLHKTRSAEMKECVTNLYDKKVLPKPKGKFYTRSFVWCRRRTRQTIHIQKMTLAEMRMIRWICGHSRRDNVRNKVTSGKVEMALMRWFKHVKRRGLDAPTRRYERIILRYATKGRGRPNKKWGKVIKQDLDLHISRTWPLNRIYGVL